MIATTSDSAVAADMAENTEPTEASQLLQKTEDKTMALSSTTSGSNVMSFMYNFGKKFTTVMAVYLIGYFNFSVAWLLGPVLVCVMREEWKKESEMKREVAKLSAMSNEKDVILARVHDLPSWVRFIYSYYHA
jgi:hypothetical protein